MDILERLANANASALAEDDEYVAKAIDEAIREIERLRADLKLCPCPGGGWNGMPKDIEPTIENCMAADACGCCYGTTLRAVEQSAGGEK